MENHKNGSTDHNRPLPVTFASPEYGGAVPLVRLPGPGAGFSWKWTGFGFHANAVCWNVCRAFWKWSSPQRQTQFGRIAQTRMRLQFLLFGLAAFQKDQHCFSQPWRTVPEIEVMRPLGPGLPVWWTVCPCQRRWGLVHLCSAKSTQPTPYLATLRLRLLLVS